ncbi:MAG: hypothetical protein H6Q14_696 [Bacteroidetes bacterium]|jgi:hypothetical protein|nr:hypothetical protein [Bacteroidota bacterium]
MKRKELILNPYFIVGLFVLLLNDFYLKHEYGNFITGKLSDFAGLLIFPMFVAVIAPKFKKHIALIVGIMFFIWKLPLFTPALEVINQSLKITLYRVVDYSDYAALLILPLSHYLINRKGSWIPIKIEPLKTISTYSLLTIAFFAFCSTSIPYRETPKGTILIDKSYTIKLPKDSVIKTIKQLGYNCDFCTNNLSKYPSSGYYQTDNIIRKGENSIVIDTIANIKYDLIEINPNKTKLTIINVTLSKEGNIQNWKTLKSLSNYYSRWLKDSLIEKID